MLANPLKIYWNGGSKVYRKEYSYSGYRWIPYGARGECVGDTYMDPFNISKFTVWGREAEIKYELYMNQIINNGTQSFQRLIKLGVNNR